MAVTFKKKSEKPKQEQDFEPVTAYQFGWGSAGGTSNQKNLLGGKGANLCEMAALGIPVPPGFIIPCSVSVEYNEAQPHHSTGALEEAVNAVVNDGLLVLSEGFGYMPLVSVRSGARVSMPGMMDTILNVGLTSETLPEWIGRIGERAALDSYRRLIQMYASVAMGVDMCEFVEALDTMKEEAGVSEDHELNVDQLSRLVTRYKGIVSAWGSEFPDTMEEQVMGATLAVFRSWNNPRAKEYRKINGYSDDWGTAVTIQAMVFGNMNDQSATGVVFTRNPSTGEKNWSGEYLVNAQGEDVVAGIRTPEDFLKLYDWDAETYFTIAAALDQLEDHYKDMQDVEFTVQDGEVFILQTRSGKRAAKAAFKIAYDMANEGLITKNEAVARVSKATLIAAMQDTIDPKYTEEPAIVGIPAGGGVVSGVAVFTAENAVNCTEPCILIREETDPNDIAGMNAAVGILTATGGMTSHAAVVARGMNKTCVVGCTGMSITNDTYAQMEVTGKVITTGAKVTIDGATGRVWVGVDVPVLHGGASEDVRTLLGWAVPPGTPERITPKNTMSAEGLMSLVQGVVKGTIYVDTALLEGNTTNELAELPWAMGLLGIALSDFTGNVVLDLDSLEYHLGPADIALLQMFGEPSTMVGQNISLIKAKAVVEWGWHIAPRLVVVTGNKEAETFLKDAGVRVAETVFTLHDLMNAKGPVKVSAEVISKVFGSPEAYETARGWVESHNGVPLGTVPESPVYWFDFLEEKVA